MNAKEMPDEESVGTQDEPIMDVDDVSDRDKLTGIIAQTVSDLGASHPRADIEAVVVERSRESGLNVSRTDISTAVGSALEGGH
ncbi:hypothetical protein [Leifsonia sp. Root4]|uniref:hypothetical protein n=1 Tax=Leifsonia sp. Root4 TaxID=1736525 RepID=UPI0012FA0ECF|nr:hypothetical protein [Leifsonia sp. Root4]